MAAILEKDAVFTQDDTYFYVAIFDFFFPLNVDCHAPTVN